MTITKRFFPNVSAGFWIAAMIAVWLAFAPTQAGGLASYIIVIGNSMEPNFHIGDLIVVHAEARYEVGDAVVYRNFELGSFVFHRIISQDLGRFTLKGDNNSWTDTYQPSREEVLGKLWLHIPKGGKIVQWIRNPMAMAFIAGVLGSILAAGLYTDRAKGRSRMNTEWFASIKQKVRERLMRQNTDESPNRSRSPQGRLLEGTFFALGLAAFASILLGAVSFLRPATRIVQDDIQFDHLGIFAYSASAPLDVYDTNSIKSGNPIFPKLTCAIEMTFQYALVGQEPENISGTYQLTATISEQLSGWQRSVPLQEQATFSGNAFGTHANLDLCKIEKLTQSMEQATEFHPGSYTLTVSPNIHVYGELSGHALQSEFNPSLEFRYDRLQFSLLRDEEAGDPFNLTQTAMLSRERIETNTVRLFGVDFAVPALRLIAVLGLVASLGGLVYFGMKIQSLSKSDPVQFIRTKFDALMIDVQNARAVESSRLVEVSSMDDLGKLAERFNAMILHAASGETHAYYVQGEGTTYRFMLNARETESAVRAGEAESEP